MLRDLLNRVNEYLNGYCILTDLETWLLSHLQRILESGEEAAIEVANQIDADLIELGEGLIDETAVRERLETYVRIRETIPVDFLETEYAAATHATATAETFRNRSEVPEPVVDLRLSHEFP